MKILPEDLSIDAQYEMSPLGRPKVAFSSVEGKKSAVALILQQEMNEWRIPLIKRTSYKGVHSGQISLPGGKVEQSDTSFLNTAIRESKEEISVELTRQHWLGNLSPLYIPPSKFWVHPNVFILKEKVEFFPEEREVEEILFLPLSQLQEKKNRKIVQVKGSSGEMFKAPAFTWNEHIVWGATAMILSEFLYVLNKKKNIISY